MPDLHVSISDRDWPNLDLIVKAGPRVVTEKARFDQAETKFQEVVSSVVKELVSSTNQRRKSNGY